MPLPGEQDEPSRRQPRGPLAPSRHTLPSPPAAPTSPQRVTILPMFQSLQTQRSASTMATSSSARPRPSEGMRRRPPGPPACGAAAGRSHTGAVRGIADARTSPTRQQHRAALEQHARTILASLQEAAPGHSTSPAATQAPGSIPFAGLPPLQGLPDIPIQAERGSEDAAPGSFDDLARRFRERLQDPPHTQQTGDTASCRALITLWDELETLIAAGEDCRKSPVDRNDRRSRALTQPILALPRTLVVATGRASWRRTRDRADGGRLPPRTGRWPLRPPRRLGVARR